MNGDTYTFVSGPFVKGKTSVGGYSGKAVKPIALRFIHAMKTHEGLTQVPISGMGGIETWRDAFEFMVLGCETSQVTTSVMQYGYRIIDDMIEGMKYYLSLHGYKGINEIIGKALDHTVPADELERILFAIPNLTGINAWAVDGVMYLAMMEATRH